MTPWDAYQETQWCAGRRRLSKALVDHLKGIGFYCFVRRDSFRLLDYFQANWTSPNGLICKYLLIPLNPREVQAVKDWIGEFWRPV